MESNKVAYSHDVLTSFKPLIVFKDSEHKIVSMDISRWGKYLVAVNSDNCLLYYNLDDGTLIDIYSHQKLGVSMARFWENHYTVICWSGKNLKNQVVRPYVWRLDNNIATFTTWGHLAEITTISVCPIEPIFWTTDKNKKAIISNYDTMEWLRTEEGIVACTFDNLGVIWATCELNLENEHLVKFYSFHNREEEFFHLHKINKDYFTEQVWAMQFSKNGKYLVFTSKRNTHLIVGVSGESQFSIICGQKSESAVASIPPEISLSPCSKYAIYIDEKNNNFCIGDLHGSEVFHFDKVNPYEVSWVMFSHEHLMFITACEHIVLWVPDFTVHTVSNLVVNQEDKPKRQNKSEKSIKSKRDKAN